MNLLYKIKKIFLILSLIFLIPLFVLAKSGACAGHGGVSCNAGPDSDGSVICNDGWRSSSVSYSSMAMCGSASVYVPEEVPVIQPKPDPVPPPNPVIIKEFIQTPATVVKEPVQAKINSVVTKETVPIVKEAPKPKVIKTAPVKKVIVEPVEEKSESDVEEVIKEVLPVAEQPVQSIPAPKKRGFWARFFGFLF